MRNSLFAYLAVICTACAGSDYARAGDNSAASAGIGCAPGDSGFDFSLRASFSDLGPAFCPHNLISSRGASISAADNQLKSQYSTGIDGLAAFVYRYYGDGDLVGFTVGSYVQGNDTYQLNPTKTQAVNGDTVTPGAFGEVYFSDGLLTHDIRVRGGEAVASTGTRSDTVVAEWFPRYQSDLRYGHIGLPVEIGSSALWYTFTPEIMVQYDRLEGGPNNSTIFSNRPEAVRIGPQFMLLFNLDKLSLPEGARNVIGNMSLQLTNHESWDTLSHRGYTWSAIALNYTVPGANNQPSHFGVSATYGYGNSEGSGNKTSQIKLGLTAKF
jgi:hypothetical protein